MGLSDEFNRIEDEVYSELRESRQVEKELEALDREKRSFLLRKLSEGDFQEAEEKAEDWFETDEEFYSFVASAARLVKSRKIQRAKNLQQKSVKHARKLYENRQNQSEYLQQHRKLRSSLEDMRENLKSAPEDLEASKQMMQEYAHKFHTLEDDGGSEVFEELVNLLSVRREELEQLEKNHDLLIDAKNDSIDGDYSKLQELSDFYSEN